MRQVRFSHTDYEKFRRIQKRPPFTARLLQVFLVQNEDVSDTFREYETTYHTEAGVDYYSLHSKTLLALLFETDKGLFTTLRPATTPKLQYYQDLQGEEFEIVVQGDYNGTQ
jgi:hypothetical protein